MIGKAMIRNHRTAEGQALGKEHARFYEQELSKRPRTLDGRCSTCAFRPGTLANGSPSTQMDVAKCLLERVPFHCHEQGREDTLCHGYELMKSGAPAIKAPWEFSKPAPENAPGGALHPDTLSGEQCPVA